MTTQIKPTWLYIKQHNITGLKYFGKTTDIYPHSYKGSGNYWKLHINKHGNDVTTELIGPFYSKEDIQLYALMFSISHNIVKSSMWANLIIENGLDGGSIKGHIKSDSTKKKMSIAQSGRSVTDETKQKISDATRGRKYSKEICNNQSLQKLEYFKTHPGNTKGKVQTTESNLKRAATLKGRIITEEAKQKMRKPRSEQAKANMITAQRLRRINEI